MEELKRKKKNDQTFKMKENQKDSLLIITFIKHASLTRAYIFALNDSGFVQYQLYNTNKVQTIVARFQMLGGFKFQIDSTQSRQQM